MAENAKWMKELRAAQKKTEELMRKTFEAQRQTDEQMKKTDEQMKRTDEKLGRVCKQFWDFWNNRWEEVEEFFYRYFQKNPSLMDLKFNDVKKTVFTSDWSEHDIVLINWEASAVISVKYKLRKKDIDSLLNREMGIIRNFYHDLRINQKLYWAVASYIISKDVEKYAKEKWLFVLTQSWEGTRILNKKWFKAKTY